MGLGLRLGSVDGEALHLILLQIHQLDLPHPIQVIQLRTLHLIQVLPRYFLLSSKLRCYLCVEVGPDWLGGGVPLTSGLRI